MTFNLGVVFDRYRSYLPAQTGPPSGTIQCDANKCLPPLDNLITWNVTAPRLGFTYDLSGNGKTVREGQLRAVLVEPRDDVDRRVVNPNSPDWWRRYNWTDTNKDGVWQNGRAGGSAHSSNGGVGSTQLDPNLQDQRYARGRLLARTRGGGEFRRPCRLCLAENRSAVPERQPESSAVSAFNVPITVRDPGPDGTQTATWNADSRRGT